MSNTGSSWNAAAADYAIFSGATSTGSNPVHSTTGSSGFAKNPAMIFPRKQAGEAISLRNNRMLSNFVIDFSDFVKQGKVII